MADTPPTTFQTLYRLTIMSGVLGCLSMAAYRYGPPPEELAGLIDRAAGMVAEYQQPGTTEAPLADAPELDTPQPYEPATGGELATLAEDAAAPTPFVDPQVAPAAALLPVAETPPTASENGALDRLDRERLVAPLLAAGAVEADVTPWGRSGALYRAAASAPLGDATTGAVRRLDAVAETPEQAVARLRYKLER